MTSVPLFVNGPGSVRVDAFAFRMRARGDVGERRARELRFLLLRGVFGKAQQPDERLECQPLDDQRAEHDGQRGEHDEPASVTMPRMPHHDARRPCFIVGPGP